MGLEGYSVDSAVADITFFYLAVVKKAAQNKNLAINTKPTFDELLSVFIVKRYCIYCLQYGLIRRDSTVLASEYVGLGAQCI